MDLIFYLSFVPLIFILNYYIKKKNLIKNLSGDKHQYYISDKYIPLSGGLFFFILSSIYLFSKNNIFLSFIFIFLAIGLLGDIKKLVSPKKRLLIQILSCLGFIVIYNLKITDTRIDLFNEILEINYISYIFTLFCVLILINGSNFIDGLNGLLIGYLAIVLFVVLKFSQTENLIVFYENFNLFFLCLLFLLIMNFFNQFFLGDGGSYSVGFFLAVLLIDIYTNNAYRVSPYFIILLLWYPCFENLFSIIRKSKRNFSPTEPDNDHLHHLLFNYLTIRLNFNKKIYSNNLSSIIINIYNLIIFLLGSQYIGNTLIQISLIFLNISIYLIIYYLLLRYKNFYLK